MSLCNTPLSTSSLKPMHGFALNFLWMSLGWTPTNSIKIGVLPLFFYEILGNCVQCLFNSLKTLFYIMIRPLTRDDSYLVWKAPRGPYF